MGKEKMKHLFFAKFTIIIISIICILEIVLTHNNYEGNALFLFVMYGVYKLITV